MAATEMSLIIILANMMDAQGNLNDLSQQRADKAAEISLQNPNIELITTGWAGNPSWGWDITIAQAMTRYLKRTYGLEIAHQNLHARDTVGDALFTKQDYVRQNSIANITVITSSFHRHRAEKIFQFIYGPNYNITAMSSDKDSIKPDRQASEQASIDAFTETMHGITPGDDDAIWRKICSDHPYYNGTIYPAIIGR